MYHTYAPSRRVAESCRVFACLNSASTCFDADHNHFAENAEQTLYFGQNNTLGWVDTAVYEKTKNAEAARKKFETAWKNADVDPRVEDL